MQSQMKRYRKEKRTITVGIHVQLDEIDNQTTRDHLDLSQSSCAILAERKMLFFIIGKIVSEPLFFLIYLSKFKHETDFDMIVILQELHVFAGLCFKLQHQCFVSF